MKKREMGRKETGRMKDVMHFSRCVEKITGEFAKLPEIGAAVCGICIKVCPFGRMWKRGEGSVARLRNRGKSSTHGRLTTDPERTIL
jgi:epoxyqueuosine reductase QueG